MKSLINYHKTELKAEYIEVITNIAENYEQISKVILFGSWALGNAKIGSDIDLAIVGTEIDQKVITDFHTMLEEETTIPNFFDVIHFESLSNTALMEHIKEKGIEIYSK